MVYAVIMAGGTGTRFWPASTEETPKQFLKLFGEQTMLQDTANRIEPLIPRERMMVVTNDRYVSKVKEQLPGLRNDFIIGEPVGRNTAPCVALAAGILQKIDEDATMVVLPADHHIRKPDKFLSYLETAIEHSQKGDNLVTIGVEPTHPETGYGYIEYNEDTSEEVEGNTVYSVNAFTEKPDEDKAKEFINKGNFLWNSGMFIWQASTILKEVKNHLSDVYTPLQEAQSNLQTEQQKEAIDQFYYACPSISVDYGIMEKAGQVFVVPGSFGWNDVGSWHAVYSLGQKNENESVVNSPSVVEENSSQNYINVSSDKLVALVGMENVAVVETEDALLICNLDEAQNVKKVVNRLRKDDNLKDYL